MIKQYASVIAIIESKENPHAVMLDSCGSQTIKPKYILVVSDDSGGFQVALMEAPMGDPFTVGEGISFIYHSCGGFYELEELRLSTAMDTAEFHPHVNRRHLCNYIIGSGSLRIIAEQK